MSCSNFLVLHCHALRSVLACLRLWSFCALQSLARYTFLCLRIALYAMYALLGIALSCFACCVLFCACSAFAPCAFAIFLRFALCAWILPIGQGECGYCALDMAPVDITRCDMARVLNIAQHKAHRYCAHTARNALYLLRTRRRDHAPATGAGSIVWGLSASTMLLSFWCCHWRTSSWIHSNSPLDDGCT